MSHAYDRRYYEDYDGLGRRGDDSSGKPLLSLLKRRVPAGRLLEVGCGYGHFLRQAERTYEAYGIDISEFAISRASEVASNSVLAAVDVESRQAMQEFVGDLRFKIIVAVNVLEHLENPRRVLEQFHRLLSPGGYLFLKVPKRDSFLRRWYSLWGREHQWEVLKDETHISLLPRGQWLRLLQATGFGYVELPTVPTGRAKRLFSSVQVLHRFYFLPWLPFVKHMNAGLTVLCWKGQA